MIVKSLAKLRLQLYINGTAGVFTWAESQERLGYSNWWPGKPDNGLNANYDCVLKSEAGWGDYSCHALEFTTTIFGPFQPILALCEEGER